MAANKHLCTAQLVPFPRPRLLIELHGREAAGLVYAFGRNVEATAEGLYFGSFDSSLHGRGNALEYRIKAEVFGKVDALKKLRDVVESGGHFSMDESSKLLLEAARQTTEISIRRHYKIYYEVRTIDEAGIIKNMALQVLRAGGSWHNLHAETINEGHVAGVGEFFACGVAGFASMAAADLAMRYFSKLPYDRLSHRPLFIIQQPRLAA